MKGYKLAVILNILLVISFVAPLIYGLYLSDWDIQKFFGLTLLTKRIDLEVETVSMDYNYRNLTMKIKLRNIGNIDFNITGIYANLSLYTNNEKYQSSYILRYDGPIYLGVGEVYIEDLIFEAEGGVTGVKIPLSGEYKLELIILVNYHSEEIPLTTTLSGSYLFKR